MSTLKVILSQAVIDEINTLSLAHPGSDTINSLVDSVNKIGYDLATSHPYYSSISQIGSTIRVNFPDGSYEYFYGTSVNPNVSNGTTSSNAFTFTEPGVMTAGRLGTTEYNYSKTASGYTFYSTGGTLTSYSAATLLPTSSPNYNPDFGNVSVQLQGNVVSDASANFSGTLTSINETADKYVSSASIQGAFQISGNSLSIGASLSSSTVTGALTSESVNYYDGSIVSFDGQGGSINIQNNQGIGLSLLGSLNLQGNNTIDVKLPSTLYGAVPVNLGDGNNAITLKGGGGNLSVSVGNGNNSVTLLDHGHAVNCGTGLNTVVYQLSSVGENIAQNGNTLTVSDATGADTLVNVSRIKFSDTSIAYDLNGNAGEAAKIIGAVFGAAAIQAHPDYVGIGLNALDNGMSMAQLSSLALQFAGESSAAAAITLLYTNIMGSAPQNATVNTFLALMQNNNISIGQLAVLAEGSSYNANSINLTGLQHTGIHYI